MFAQIPDGAPPWNSTLDPCAGLDLTFDRDHTLVMTCRGGVVCIGGKGYQSRAASTTSMIMEAVKLLGGRGIRLHDFTRRLVEITDDGINSCKGKHMTYTLPWVYRPGFCDPHLIPDFTMWAFPEAGLLPNFTGLTRNLQNISQRPPRRRRCGFAGSIQTNAQRGGLHELAQQADVGSMLDFVDTSGGKERWSMEKQTEEWACMIDVAGQAYSGRVPMLLHTGRPVLMVERDYFGATPGHFLDRMWYSDWLEPDVHYIPVLANLSNLVPALRKALSKEGEAIGRNAQRLAAANLTTEKSIEYIADILSTLSDRP